MFQLAWALTMAAPLAASISKLARHQTASAALGVIVASAIWAFPAAIGWMLRLAALSTCGRWGARSRRRVRNRTRGGRRK